LSRWALTHLVNRVDCFGAYLNPDAVYTSKDILTPEILEAHFAATGPDQIIGAHSTVAEEIEGPDGETLVSCTSKWICNDIDWHNPGPPPAANENAAKV
jgi:hypothetical protein